MGQKTQKQKRQKLHEHVVVEEEEEEDDEFELEIPPFTHNPTPTPTPTLDDVIHVSDDDSADYPKIGPGYSDEVSVISEMSTPTVMTRQHVKDWEHYREVNRGRRKPLGLVGGGVSRPSPGGGKSRNALNRVRSSAALPSPMSSSGSGGAAAQRRRTYQKTM